MVKEIAFTEYPAQDVAALRRWYEEKLELRFDEPHVQEGTEKYAQAKVGGGILAFRRSNGSDETPAAHPESTSKSTTSPKRSPTFATRGSKLANRSTLRFAALHTSRMPKETRSASIRSRSRTKAW
jgi:hypothetical protein